MRNLLSAGLRRLWKDKVFWVGVAAMLIIFSVVMWGGARQAVISISEGYMRTLDDYYFVMAPFIGLFCAVFTALFIGTEHSDGAIRNKIIVGRERTKIYLSNYLICLIAGVCFVAAWFLAGLVGVPFLGLWEIGVQSVLLYALIAFFFTAAWTGIFTLLCMLSVNKAVAAVLTVLLCFGLLVASALIYNALSEPEFIGGMVITANGMQMADPSPNPNFISGTARTVLQFFADCLPGGQGILMSNLEIGRPILSLIASVAITLTTISAGVFAFSKKDLK